MIASEWRCEYERLSGLVRRHEDWRAQCLNLCAAENAMSPEVRGMLCTDLARRYGDYTGRDLRARRYFGCREIADLEEAVAALAMEVFGARHVELRPISGHTAGNAVIMGLCQPGDLVLELGRAAGGHRLATKLASSSLVSLRVDYLPFDAAAFNVDVERTLHMVRDLRPRLVILGASNFLFPSPVRELADGLRESSDTILAYDVSHVLGLVAGGEFQHPLAEGAHIVLGGTQKSFPGPQGGLIYSNAESLMEAMGRTVHPALISNHHLARLPALGIALLEMKVWGGDYARQVIRNAQALGSELAAQGVPVVAADRGFTASHTVLVQTSPLGDAESLGHALEEANVIVTAVCLPDELGGAGLRLGTAEITRRGMDESPMASVAATIADVLLHRRPPDRVKARVSLIAQQFPGYRYTLESALGADVDGRCLNATRRT
ncbi:MAG: serine hydroxymethyltransferase [Chloroflexi bacterium]|nr:serine hydroxymethyltransferase [Chloroflexota bacterium]